MAAEEQEQPAEGAPAWMATFADLCTLLLTFFVLLLSFANTDVLNFRTALGSVKEAFGVQKEHPGDFTGLTTSLVELSTKESTPNLDLFETQLMEKIEVATADSKLKDKIETSVSELGVTVRIKEQVLFPAGSDELATAGHEVMDVIGNLCKLIPMPVWIEGHTDDIPINTKRFPSNWELSTARAISAMRYLTEKSGVNPRRIRVGGYAHVHPLASNETSEGRLKNRRVEFIFTKPNSKDGSKIDPAEVLQGSPENMPGSKQVQTNHGGKKDPIFFPSDEEWK